MIWWLWWNVATRVTWRPPPLLGRLLFHLPEPPPGETGGGRPRGVGRSSAPRPRTGRASGAARALEEVRVEQAWNRAMAWGDSWRQRRRPATPEAEDKGRLVRPQGPAEVRAARLRPPVPGGAASSSSSAAGAPASGGSCSCHPSPDSAASPREGWADPSTPRLPASD